MAANIYLDFSNYDSYLQSTDEIYIMEAGIINNNLEFAEGEYHEITYDFDNEKYTELKSKYNIEKYVKDGSEFKTVCRYPYWK